VIGFIVGERTFIVVFPSVSGFALADLREQRVCIKFCFKLGKTAAEKNQMLKQAFGDHSLGQPQTYNWYKRFKNGMAERRLMRKVVRGGHQLVSHKKMLLILWI
jgi:hypothetical protein